MTYVWWLLVAWLAGMATMECEWQVTRRDPSFTPDLKR